MENCRDYVDVSRATLQVPNGNSSPVGSPETAARPTRVMRVTSLSKTTKNWDASNLAPRTQLVLALPVAVVQGQPRLLRYPLEFRVVTFELRTECKKVQFRHFVIELLRQEADVKRERLV